jgi:hypothetical protein
MASEQPVQEAAAMATRLASRGAAARGFSTARRSRTDGRTASWLAAAMMSEQAAEIQAAVPLLAAARVDRAASRLGAARGSRRTGWSRSRTSWRGSRTGRRRASGGRTSGSRAATGLAAAAVGPQHPVEQIETEALSTQAERQHHRSKYRIPLHFKPLTFVGGTVVNCRFPTAGPQCASTFTAANRRQSRLPVNRRRGAHRAEKPPRTRHAAKRYSLATNRLSSPRAGALKSLLARVCSEVWVDLVALGRPAENPPSWSFRGHAAKRLQLPI